MKKIILRSLLALVIFIALVVGYIIYLFNDSDTISEGKLVSDYGIEKPALLVVDIQEAVTGSLSTYAEHVRQSENLIKNVNEVIDSCSAKGIPVIYIGSEIDNWFINLLNDSMKKGSPGTRLDKRLHNVSGNIFTKSKKDAFLNPALDEFLISNKINKLYIVGLDAAECVFNTTYAAFNRNYDITMIEDCLIAKTDESKNEAMNKFRNDGIEIINSSQFFAL